MTSTTTGYSTPSMPLKRLGPVRENASFYSSKVLRICAPRCLPPGSTGPHPIAGALQSSEIASNVYATLKQYAPKSALPTLNNLEETVSSYSYPAMAKLQDRSDSVLKSLDGQVRPCRRAA